MPITPEKKPTVFTKEIAVTYAGHTLEERDYSLERAMKVLVDNKTVCFDSDSAQIVKGSEFVMPFLHLIITRESAAELERTLNTIDETVASVSLEPHVHPLQTKPLSIATSKGERHVHSY